MRFSVHNRVAKISSIVMIVYVCLLWVELLLNPDDSPKLFYTLIGTSIIVWGIIRILFYFSRDLYNFPLQYELISGFLIIGIGIMFLIKHDNVIDSLCTALGVGSIVLGVRKVQVSIEAKSTPKNKWRLILILAVAAIVIGLILAFRIFSSDRVLVAFLGIDLLLNLILNISTAFFPVKSIGKKAADDSSH